VAANLHKVTVEGNQHQVKIEGLNPATLYIFTVVAENRVGRSLASAPVTAGTEEEKPTGTPENIKVSSVSSSALMVSWEPPSDSLIHGTIRGYYLGFKDV
ncbi:unnamed protein product, partial [Meganyctiphanes norvegica]